MTILRLTASLAIALAAPLLPAVVLSQSMMQDQMSTSIGNSQSTGTIPSSSIAQSTGTTTGTGQSSYATPSNTNFQTPGTNLQTPGANLSAPGAAPTTSNVQSGGTDQSTTTTGTTQSTQSTSGTTQTSTNGQAIGPSLPNSTRTPGAEQTFVNGQSTGTRQVAPPLSTNSNATGNTTAPATGQTSSGQATTTGASGASGNSGSVLNPPQFIPGAGGVPAPQPTTGTAPAAGVAAPQTQAAPTQPAAGRTATGSVAPNASPAPQTQLQQGQGTLDAALQQATCAQDWGRAIRLVNTAIAAAPTSQSGYRSQLASYRSRLQNLQAKGVRAPNWGAQCRSGNIANGSAQ